MTKIGTRREPEYKELNFDTALRNPERLKNVLELIKEYENLKLNDDNLLDIVSKMYISGLVTSDDFDLRYLPTDEKIKQRIIEINRSRNADGGFPKGYQSRFWTYMRTLSEFGFVYARYNEKLLIGDVGHKLIENKIDAQEAFALQSMKYNWKSPYRNVSNDYNYFKFIIKVLRELDKKKKKLNYNQFVLSLFSKEDDPNEFIDLITKNTFATENSVYEYLKSIYGRLNAETTVLKDYPDTVIRMLRLTGFVNIVNEGILLIELNNDMSKFIDYFIDKTYVVDNSEKEIAINYFNKINIVSDDELSIIKKNRQTNVEIMDYNFVLNRIVKDYKFDENSIIEYINNIGLKNRNKEFKYIDYPLQFEFFLSILLYLVYGDEYSIKPNYKTDAYGMPISHAPGKCGDIEIVGNHKYWLLEVSLIRNKAQQLNNETANLFRHISDSPWAEKYMSFVAPVVHEDTYKFFNALIIDYIKEYKNNNFNAKCYKTEELISECLTKSVFEDMKKNTIDYKKSLLEILN